MIRPRPRGPHDGRSADGDPSAPPRDQLRLMTLASRLYHDRGIRQRDIAARLGISQPGVSRLLAQAEDHGIVRTVVVAPDGFFPEPEEVIEDAYGLRECTSSRSRRTARCPASSAVRRPATSTRPPCGVRTSGSPRGARPCARWSGRWTRSAARASRTSIEMLGDLGAPLLQHEAGHATLRLAALLGAEPVLLRAPGVLAAPALRAAVLRDPHAERARCGCSTGSTWRSSARAGRLPRPAARGRQLLLRGAARGGPRRRRGGPARPALHRRPRRAPPTRRWTSWSWPSRWSSCGPRHPRSSSTGGTSKWAPLAAALRGGWVDVLVTDLASARYLISHAAPP